MSIATVVTRGYGSFGSIADVTRRGYSGSATTVIGRRRRTKFYTGSYELPKTVQKKAEKQDTKWLEAHFAKLIDNAKTEQRLFELQLQLTHLESQYQLVALKVQAVTVARKLETLREQDDEEALYLLH